MRTKPARGPQPARSSRVAEYYLNTSAGTRPPVQVSPDRHPRDWGRFFGHRGEIIPTDAPITDLGWTLEEVTGG